MNCRCYSVDEVILIISRRIYYEAEDFRLFWRHTRVNSLQPLPNLTLIKDGKNINPAILINLVKQTSMNDMFTENNVYPEN